MEQAFSNWLNDNGLVKAFTTNAGDTFYVNTVKQFGVIKPSASYYVQSFYFSDVMSIRTFDDENLLAEAIKYMPEPRFLPKSNRHSTNEIKINLLINNGSIFKLQIFKATNGNVDRESDSHINLVNYAAQITQLLYNYIKDANAPSSHTGQGY